MLTTLMVTKAITETKQPLEELAKIITKYPQITVNLDATPAQKENFETSEKAKALLLDYNEKLKPVSGRLLARPSGTENLIRITMWGTDQDIITNLANELKTKLGEVL